MIKEIMDYIPIHVEDAQSILTIISTVECLAVNKDIEGIDRIKKELKKMIGEK